MALSIPPYINVGALEKLPIVHDWSDWDPYPILGLQNAHTQARLAGLSGRAQIAYSIACAEWVIYRFSEKLDDVRPYSFIEAAWASEMSEKFALPEQFVEAEWKGPIKGPIDLSLVTIINTAYSVEDRAGDVDSAFAELIALHVLPEAEPFTIWRDKVLARFEQLFGRTTNDLLGQPVPRESLDPDQPVEDRDLQEYVKQFLSRLDETTNPCLHKVGSEVK